MKERALLSSAHIRIIAYMTMLIDHIGSKIILSFCRSASADSFQYWKTAYELSRMVGRVAFPLFCFLLCEGIRKSSNRKKYLTRLLLLAIVSEPCFDYFSCNSFWDTSTQNVIITLFFGGMVLISFDYLEKNIKNNIFKNICRLSAIGIAILITALLHTDYSITGIILIVVINYLQDHRELSLTNMASVLLLTIYFANAFKFAVTNSSVLLQPSEWMNTIFEPAFSIQLYEGLAVIAMYFYSGQRGKLLPRLFYYGFYPIHLLIIGVITALL